MKDLKIDNRLLIVMLSLLLAFNISVAQWTQIGVDIDGEFDYDQSGFSVSLSADGSTIAIGSPFNNNLSGHVRVHKRINGIWTQIGSDIDGIANTERFGWSVSLSADGSVLAIGAPTNSSGGTERGEVKVFKLINGNWTQLGASISGKIDGELSGLSVALSSNGSTVAIGAPFNDGGTDMTRSRARVYNLVKGIWTQIGVDIVGEGSADFAGLAVSISSDASVLAVGAYLNDANGVDRGHVRVYRNLNGTWTQLGNDLDGLVDSEQFGYSIDLADNGLSIAIGAVGSGIVRVFKYINGYWIQHGNNIYRKTLNDYDYSGVSVSISQDGNTLAIGAHFNQGGGIYRGFVRVFKIQNGTWIQKGTDINGEADYDFSGSSISLSADGLYLAIGAPLNDGNGITNRGHVRVYSYCSTTQKFINAIIAIAKQKGNRLYVCHQGSKTVKVGEPDLFFHLFHGDQLGKCGINYCESLEFRKDDISDFIATGEDKFSLGSLALYPNPARNVLNVKLPFHEDQTIFIEVYNSLGQSVINYPYHSMITVKNQAVMPVNITSLSNGMYIIKVTGNGIEASSLFTKY